MKQTVVLVILDGWGLGKADNTNPIHEAHPQFVAYAEQYFPYGTLQASGIAVGLPWGEPGNSEVGHLTIGAGKILYQHYPKISLAIQDGSFFENPVLKAAFSRAAEKSGNVHCIGLLTAGNVHAHLSHLEALIEMTAREKCSRFYLHLVTDGKDSPPQSSLALLARVTQKIAATGAGAVASLVGRYYAMNRDGSWALTEKTYALLTGRAASAPDAGDAIRAAYAKNMTDEFIEPTLLGAPHPVQNGDSLIFFNFREDSMRQLSEVFMNPEFKMFSAPLPPDLYVASLVPYHEAPWNAHVAFPKEIVNAPIGRVVSDAGRLQLRVAETEKAAHVTFFLNGLREEPFPNEYRVIIPSESLTRPDIRPEMRAPAITDRVLAALNEGGFDLIVINYANPDIIAHTGNFEAALRAVRATDNELLRLVKAALDHDHVLLVTADHGNAESLLDLKTGRPETAHNENPVPVYLIGRAFSRRNPPRDPYASIPVVGLLSDVAPTILDLLRLPPSPEMTGSSLLPQLLNP